MRRLAAALAAVVCVVAALHARRASACSCINLGPRVTFSRAKLVFFGRARKARVKGRWHLRPIEVLHVLKGKLGKSLLSRSPANVIGGCRRSYGRGEVSLVFTNGSDISTCAGNYALSVQMGSMAEYLVAAGGSASVDQRAVAFALEQVRAKVGLGKPNVTLRLRYKPWNGFRLARGALRARVVAAPARRHVDIRQLVGHGRVTLVSGVEVSTMRFFDALVLRRLARRHRRGSYELLALRHARGCAKQAACVERGRCSARDGSCLALSRRDCASSRGCTSDARCSPRAGRCVIGGARDCSSSQSCRLQGLCDVHRGKCVATRAAHCRKSQMCREFAECTFDRTHRACVVGSQADCASSSVVCKANGRCRFDKKQARCVR